MDSYKKISAEDLSSTEAPKRPPEKKPPEKKGLGYSTTLLYRQIGVNRDLALLALLVGMSTYFGYSLKDINLSLNSIIEIAIELTAAALVIVWKLHTPPGKLAKTLAARGNKKDEELDEWGRTITPSGK